MEKEKALEIVIKVVNAAVAAGLFKTTADVVTVHEALSALVDIKPENRQQASS